MTERGARKRRCGADLFHSLTDHVRGPVRPRSRFSARMLGETRDLRRVVLGGNDIGDHAQRPAPRGARADDCRPASGPSGTEAGVRGRRGQSRPRFAGPARRDPRLRRATRWRSSRSSAAVRIVRGGRGPAASDRLRTTSTAGSSSAPESTRRWS